MNKKFEIVKNMALLTQIGLTMVSSILLCIFLGGLLDKVFNTDYIFKIIFMIIGVAAGFLSIYKIIINVINKK